MEHEALLPQYSYWYIFIAYSVCFYIDNSLSVSCILTIHISPLSSISIVPLKVSSLPLASLVFMLLICTCEYSIVFYL